MSALTRSICLLGLVIWLIIGAYVAMLSEDEFRKMLAPPVDRSASADVQAILQK